MKTDDNFALRQHEHVPANWYHQSIKIDPFQKFWHKSRQKEVKKIIESVKGGRVLDVGSADGIFSKVIFDQTNAKELIGVEVLEKSVNWAKKHWKETKGLKFQVGLAEDIKFKANSFDAIFCLEVLEHVHNPNKVLKEFKRVMKKGGYGIFLVPSDNFLFRIIWFLWLHFYPRGWVWKDTHVQTFRDDQLPKVCRKAGFKVEVYKKFNLGMLALVKVRKI